MKIDCGRALKFFKEGEMRAEFQQQQQQKGYHLNGTEVVQSSLKT